MSGSLGMLVEYSPRGAGYCLADWRRLLGGAYGRLEPHLEPVPGRVTGTYPVEGGRYAVRMIGGRWYLVADEDQPDLDDPELTIDEVRMWRLGEEGWRLAAELAAGPAAEARPGGGGPAGAESAGGGRAYEVGGAYRVEPGAVRVAGLADGEIWSVPAFAREVLCVLLEDRREGGLTSEAVHLAASARYRERYPELSEAEGRGGEIVSYKSLGQYFRYTDRKGRKVTHGLYDFVERIGNRTPCYRFKSGSIRVFGPPDLDRLR